MILTFRSYLGPSSTEAATSTPTITGTNNIKLEHIPATSGSVAEDISVFRDISQDVSPLRPLHFHPDMSNPLHKPSPHLPNSINTINVSTPPPSDHESLENNVTSFQEMKRKDVDKQVLCLVPSTTARKKDSEKLGLDVSARSLDAIDTCRAPSQHIDGHHITGSIMGDNERLQKRARSSESADNEDGDENRALRDKDRNKRRRLSTPHVQPHAPHSSRFPREQTAASNTSEAPALLSPHIPRLPEAFLTSVSPRPCPALYRPSNRYSVISPSNTSNSDPSHQPPPLAHPPSALEDESFRPSLNSEEHPAPLWAEEFRVFLASERQSPGHH